MLMSHLEDFDDTPVPVQKTPPTSEKSPWSKALAWGVLALGGLYLLNPLAGIDLLPDVIPVAGNLDEAAVVLIVLGALRYLDIPLPDFIESWIQPSRRLPETIDQDE
jgi:hypothetical protein